MTIKNKIIRILIKSNATVHISNTERVTTNARKVIFPRACPLLPSAAAYSYYIR